LFNVTGQPAISLPVGFGADGLPTGVQIVGKPLNEDRLLQVALQMESAHPWAHQRPAPLGENVGDPARPDA
jgi:amidase